MPARGVTVGGKGDKQCRRIVRAVIRWRCAGARFLSADSAGLRECVNADWATRLGSFGWRLRQLAHRCLLFDRDSLSDVA